MKMKEVSSLTPRLIPLRDLAIGEVFNSSGSGICIKSYDAKNTRFAYINLYDGKFRETPIDELIYPLTCELHYEQLPT